MEIASKYDPSKVEDKWYAYWLEHGFFRSVPDGREPYCIVIPPPNVTGVLHMGHMLNNTIQDVMVRRARMQGKNACWVPGTDHASIATEAKVVSKLKESGIDKSLLTREEFLQHAWEWKNKHGGIILEQLKKLGASCDWDRTRFTMDEALYDSVIDVFIDLYNKGLIYRGARMVNWDSRALTAVSDEEVIYKEQQTKLYYVRYQVEGASDQWVTIATTRPETILGDTAICVHPDDERYHHLKGKKILVPLINRTIPVIFDEYVDREFGTGALKVTPAHDINDYNLGLKYRLEVVDTFNPDGTMSEAAQLFVGENRFVVRKKIIKELEKASHLVKTEDYINKVGYSERTDEPIEPRISVQWFLRMKELATPALELVENDSVKFHPVKYKNMYRHWMENVTDWCISRQLWWGQRIPAYYLPDGEIIVARSKEEALSIAGSDEKWRCITDADLRQDDDVLDTWFSSWLWPISVFDGIRNPENPDIKYYYPTNDLVTAPEIIFFWVARMIMAGWEYRKEVPFRNVYFTGIVRDKQGRKMSKSLGNSPEPLELIKNYGADAVRLGMLLCSPAGNDLPFDESLIEQGRNFCNKIWNAMRFIKGLTVDDNAEQPLLNKETISWFQSLFNYSLIHIENLYKEYKLSEIVMSIHRLIKEDFCSWYIEIIKPSPGLAIDRESFEKTLNYFENLLKVLHPFMPFITEEIYQNIRERNDGESISLCNIPTPGNYDMATIEDFEYRRLNINDIRNLKNENNIPNKEQIDLKVIEKGQIPSTRFDLVVNKLVNSGSFEYLSEPNDNYLSVLSGTTIFQIPHFTRFDNKVELEKKIDELKYWRGFYNLTNKKLKNPNFANKAPKEIVEKELKKLSDAKAKIKVLEKQIGFLQKK